MNYDLGNTVKTYKVPGESQKVALDQRSNVGGISCPGDRNVTNVVTELVQHDMPF